MVRMSNAEAIMWAVEKDPALRSDFCNLTLLDRRPTEDRIEATMARGLAAIPRLRQRVVAAPLRITTPEFAEDPTLDIGAHLRTVGVPSPGDARALLDLCGSLAEQPFDRARPLWEFTLIDGLPDGRTALLQKLHHTITDGVGGLRLSLSLVDLERNPPPDETATADVAADDQPEPPTTSPVGVTRDAVLDAAHRSADAMRRALDTTSHVVSHPNEVPARAADLARLLGSLQRQLLVTDVAHSDVMTARSLRRHFATHEIALAPLRAGATKLGGSVNDAFITAVASALGRYHARHGSDATELRLAMPVSTREKGDTGTNRFVPARVLVPIQPADDIPMLFDLVHDRLDTAKHESAFTAADALAGIVSALPTALLVAITRSQTRTIDFAASNLRGSPVPLYLAGARILASYPFGPRTGSALNVTMLSYCDDVHIGCNLDPAAIVDPSTFMRDIADAFAAFDAFC